MSSKLKIKRKKQESQFITRQISFSPSSLNEENRTIEAIMTTDSPTEMWDYSRGEQVEEILLMSGSNYPKQIPLLDSHNRESMDNVIGSVRDIRVECGNLVGIVSFATGDEKSESAFQKFKQGHATDFSIGYYVTLARYIDPGEKMTISGRTFEAKEKPVRISLEWHVKELSAVPIGADPNAKARSSEMIVESIDGDGEKIDVEIKKGNKMEDELEKKENSTVKVDEEAIKRKASDDAVKQERERIKLIRAESEGIEFASDMAIRAIEDGISVDEFRSKLVEKIRSDRKKSTDAAKNIPGVIIRENDIETETRGVEASFISVAFGDEYAHSQYGDEVMESSNKYRNMDSLDLCRHALRNENKNIPMGKEGLIRRAFSTTFLPKVLGNIANKSMLKGYSEVPGTWERWCVTGDVPDFKTNTKVRMTDSGDLQEVYKSGAIKHGDMEEEYEQFSITTYAKQFGISRQDLYNDDQSAFTEVPQLFGRRARKKISDLVYAHLLANGTLSSGYALCGTDNDNYISGTDTVMNATYAVDGLDAALTKFLKMKDAGSSYVDVNPRYLLVPPEVSTVAESVFKSTEFITGTTARVPKVNPFAGRFEVLTEPRLSDSNITGYSTTAWYLVADPSMVDTLGVYFLRGTGRTPTIERTEADFDYLGIRYRVYLDVGVKALDYRGIVKSKGAS